MHIGPAATPGHTQSYFTPTVAAGGSAGLKLIVANPSASTCTVNLAAAAGKTAVNSGNTYLPVIAPDPCTGTGCWVEGVPSSISVPAHHRRAVHFTVRVPAGTGAGQYLAGVVGSGGTPGGARSGVVRLRVESRVAIGVAVRVPGPLTAKVSIPTVTTSNAVLPTAETLRITEVNTGNTWEHPKGSATVRSGSGTITIPVGSNTLLADGRALLTVSAGTVPSGSWPTRVELHYGDHQVAVWEGTLAYAPPKVVKDGNTFVVTQEVLPWWATLAIGLLGAVLLGVLVLFLLVLARRRRRRGPEAAAGAR